VADLVEQPFDTSGEVVRAHRTTLPGHPRPTRRRPTQYPRPATPRPDPAGSCSVRLLSRVWSFGGPPCLSGWWTVAAPLAEVTWPRPGQRTGQPKTFSFPPHTRPDVTTPGRTCRLERSPFFRARTTRLRRLGRPGRLELWLPGLVVVRISSLCPCRLLWSEG
jgi:hypothetical protein